MSKGQTVERIRGRKLQRIRDEHFRANPLCVMCRKEGKVGIATELDHIVALTNGGTNDPDNYQGLCPLHHELKTAQDLGYTPKQQIGADGWPCEPTQAQASHARWRRAARG